MSDKRKSDEIIQRKQTKQKIYMDSIISDSDKHAAYLLKEKQRYQRRKTAGKIKTIRDMNDRQQHAQQKQ